MSHMSHGENRLEAKGDVELNLWTCEMRERANGRLVAGGRSGRTGQRGRLVMAACAIAVTTLVLSAVLSRKPTSTANNPVAPATSPGSGGFLIGYETLAVTILMLPLLLLIISFWRWLTQPRGPLERSTQLQHGGSETRDAFVTYGDSSDEDT